MIPEYTSIIVFNKMHEAYLEQELKESYGRRWIGVFHDA